MLADFVPTISVATCFMVVFVDDDVPCAHIHFVLFFLFLSYQGFPGLNNNSNNDRALGNII